MEGVDKQRIQNTISKLRTAYDMMEIIETALSTAKRTLSLTERYTNQMDDPKDSVRSYLKVIEDDIVSLKGNIADDISNQTDLLNEYKEK